MKAVTTEVPAPAVATSAASPNAAIASNSTIRILKIGTCPSLSGKSTLTYHVGCMGNGDIYLRVFANSSAGYFSKEWLSLSVIAQTFAKIPAGIALTAHLLTPLFQGKSANSHGFLFAVLKNEGLVQQAKDQRGVYERSDAGHFVEAIKALVATDVDLQIEEKAAIKVVPVKKAKAAQSKSEGKSEGKTAKGGA